MIYDVIMTQSSEKTGNYEKLIISCTGELKVRLLKAKMSSNITDMHVYTTLINTRGCPKSSHPKSSHFLKDESANLLEQCAYKFAFKSVIN